MYHTNNLFTIYFVFDVSVLSIFQHNDESNSFAIWAGEIKKIVSYLMSLTLFIMLLTFHIIGNGEGVFNSVGYHIP